MLIKGKSFQFRLTSVVQKWFVCVIAVVRRDHKQGIEMHQSEIDNLKGMFLNLLLRWFYFLIGLLCRAKSISQLGKSWIFLNRLIWKVGMKWTTIEEEEGVNILLKYVCCVIWATSRKNTHTVRSRPTTKREIRRFRNGLVGELKVHERKLLRWLDPVFWGGYHPTLKLSGIPTVTFIASLTHRMDNI